MKWLELNGDLQTQGLNHFFSEDRESTRDELELLGVCIDLPHNCDVKNLVSEKHRISQWGKRFTTNGTPPDGAITATNSYRIHVIFKKNTLWVLGSRNTSLKDINSRRWFNTSHTWDVDANKYCSTYFEMYWPSWPKRSNQTNEQHGYLVGGTDGLFSATGKTSFERRKRRKRLAYPELTPCDTSKRTPPSAKARLNGLHIDRYKHLTHVTAVQDRLFFARYSPTSSSIKLGHASLNIRNRCYLGKTIAHELAHHFDHLYFETWQKKQGLRIRQSRRWRTRNSIEKSITYGHSGRLKHISHSVRDEFIAESGGLTLRLLAQRFYKYEGQHWAPSSDKYAALRRQVRRALLPGAMTWLSCFKSNGIRVPPTAQRRLHAEAKFAPSRMVRLRPIKTQ